MEKEIEYKGYIIRQDYDEFAEDPTNGFDFTFLALHDDPRLGWNSISEYYNNIKLNIIEYFNNDEDFTFDHLTDLDYDELDEDKETVNIIFNELQELYYIDLISIYEHSGISVSRGAQQGWDSWVEGIVYTTRQNNVSKEEVDKELDKFLSLYNAYLNGECYTIKIYSKDDKTYEEIIDSFDYFGYKNEDDMIDIAKKAIDNIVL